MKKAVLLLAVAAVAHLVLAGSRGLAEDEAYYWVWSQHLAAGYYDHPPLIAWLIAAGTGVLGDSELGVRLLPGLLTSLGLLPVVSLSPRPTLAALALAFTPLLFLGGVLAGPDAPLVAAWGLGLWAAARERWLVLGVAAGLAMLSKYTGVLLLPVCVLAWPSSLRRRGPWLAAAAALLVYAPNLLWNLQHDIVSWRFQLGHAAGAETAAGAGSLAFLGAQAGLVGPLLFLVAGAWLLLRARAAIFGDDRLLRLCWWSAFPLLVLATLSGGEANWGAPAWIGALLGLTLEAGRWPRIAGFAAGTSAALSLVAGLHVLTPLFDLQGDPTHRLEGGRILADSVRAWDVQPVLAARYQESALIHFYSGIPAHKAPGIGRPDQYDLWPTPVTDQVDRLLFVRPWRGDSSTPLDAQGWQRSAPNAVTAYAQGTDPLSAVPVARWQVFDMRRERP